MARTNKLSAGILGIMLIASLIGCTNRDPNSDPANGHGRVIVGADRLFTEYVELIRNKKVGLVSNHSGKTSDGSHLADLIHEHPDIELISIMGMEYNVRTNDYSLPRDPESTIDPDTGARKYSLYGETHKPTPEMLQDVEIIVFDIQEVGARFYEHVNILGFVMEAASERGIPVVVLDRPNPVGGLHVDGFVADSSQYYTFGSYTRIPIIHGMTMGELARLYNEEGLLRSGKKVELTVVEMIGWKRNMWFDQTGLDWSKPSPNLYSLESVLAYLGNCIFEAYNVSEGRGTDKPFEYIGAPWVDNTKVVELLEDQNLAGVTFEPIEFVPTKLPHLSRDPELAGQLSKGVYVKVTDRNTFESYKSGVALLWAIHSLHSDSLVLREQTLVRLTGTDRLISLIQNGYTPAQIYASWDAELQVFKALRSKYLIYPEN
jgi:uncharacterized protein YbbC (DUF1343 family)